jgi:formylglycine-generating enzyme required for sulfatase activity
LNRGSWEGPPQAGSPTRCLFDDHRRFFLGARNGGGEMSTRSCPLRVAGFLPAIVVVGLTLRAAAVAGASHSSPGDMIMISTRAFTMGSDRGEGDDDEEPEHRPYISAFHIDRYEVTNAQYADALSWAAARGYAFWTGSNVVQSRSHWTPYLEVSNVECRIRRSGSAFVAESGYENHPVVGVSWCGAAAYCNWRSLLDGLTPCYDTKTWKCDFSANGYRLPTEAEWEKAARGSSDERTYPWGYDAPDCERANCWQDSIGGCVGGTAPVGSYQSGRSPYSLYDMAGNVWEWCNDWYDSSYYGRSPKRDPRGPSRGTYKVLRGGSWYFHQSFVRCANRYANSPTLTSYIIGFRCARKR